jgi:hypothetical protein
MGMTRALLTATLCALLSPASAAEIDWSRAQQITLITGEYAFEPSAPIRCADYDWAGMKGDVAVE